jgi:hypothetical protein
MAYVFRRPWLRQWRRPILFVSPFSNKVIVSAVESFDTASINAKTIDNITVNALETRDTASINSKTIDNITVSVTESRDTSSIKTIINSSVTISATESRDTARINLYVTALGTGTLIVRAVESPDISSIKANTVAPARVYAFQTAGGGVSGNFRIPYDRAYDIVKRWYNVIGLIWLEENSISSLRPSQRAYLYDTVKQSPQIQFLLQNGYSLKDVFDLIEEAKEASMEEDDERALSVLLD